MKPFFGFLAVFLLLFCTLSNTSEAARFGAGKSLGKSWSSRYHATQSFNQPPHQFKRSTFQQSAFKNMLIGALTGGLIGSLLFGHGFHGVQFFDLIILLAVFFVGWKLLHLKFRLAFASHNNASQTTQHHYQAHQHISSGHNTLIMPDWFDETQFLQSAKSHYVLLQQAWDTQDMSLIKPYCTVEFFREIAEERRKIPGEQRTEILTLDARLIEIFMEGEEIMIAMEFSALLRENDDTHTQPKDVIEVWTISHNKQAAQGDWLICGITTH